MVSCHDNPQFFSIYLSFYLFIYLSIYLGWYPCAGDGGEHVGVHLRVLRQPHQHIRQGGRQSASRKNRDKRHRYVAIQNYILGPSKIINKYYVYYTIVLTDQSVQ